MHTRLLCDSHPLYSFRADRSVLLFPTTQRQFQFPVHVRLRKGHPGKLLRFDIGEELVFKQGLSCRIVSIDRFSYNGRTALIHVERIAHIAP
jgi:hypothetical protein